MLSKPHDAAVLSLTLLSGLALLPLASASGDGLPPGPDFKEVLSLPRVGSPRIAPDGGAVAYPVTAADWEENRYDTELWLARPGEEPFQLTRTAKGSSSDPKWSPDGRWLAFLADRGSGRQVQLIRAAGGEAQQLTAIAEGVEGCEWSPDGRHLALAVTEPEGEASEKRKKLYGEFAVEDAEHRMTHLWLLEVEAAGKTEGGVKRPEEKAEEGEEKEAETSAEKPAALRRLTGGDRFTVGSFAWSPDGRWLAFDHRPDPRITSFDRSDLSLVAVATGEVRPLVARPGYDGDPIWSPDGGWVLFETADGETAYYRNDELAKVPVGGGEPTVLTGSFDENVSALAWLPGGIRFLAFQRTERALFHLDPESGEVRRLTDSPPVVWSADYSRDGSVVALLGEGADRLGEIYRGAAQPYRPEAVTAMTPRVSGWPLGTREVIQWPSRDGTAIEGVLWKPEGFDPDRRHPLLVIIHGGPAAVSLPSLVSSYVYPVQQWLARGALILMPNYRGSTGYGEEFRALNVRNLGVGDAWDVLSGVDHLVAQGIADPERLGAMGWSQGGYISAFLATTSDRFRAISVGAGISNWMTYYVNTDIHPFTRHYLEATPWEDPEIYAKTSPMTYIRDARTPTLIQHGEFDRRVPIPNAYELYQGLEDQGVATRLIVYKGFGHGIDKPKERLAAVWHNWQWFAHHLWGEEVELPLTTADEGDGDGE